MKSQKQYVLQKLDPIRDKKGLQTVADATGISVHTIIKIARQYRLNPSSDTVELMAKYFDDRDHDFDQQPDIGDELPGEITDDLTPEERENIYRSA